MVGYLRKVSAAIFGILFVSSMGYGQYTYEQPPLYGTVGGGDAGGTAWSDTAHQHPLGSPTGVVRADDFYIGYWGTNEVVSEVAWWGGQPDATGNYTIRIFSDNNGAGGFYLPDTVVYEAAGVAATATQQTGFQVTTGAGVQDMYLYQYVPTDSWVLQSDTWYWLSIFTTGSAVPVQTWAWEWNDNVAAPPWFTPWTAWSDGSGSGYTAGWHNEVVPTDGLAFGIQTIPEPATLVLMTMGVGGVMAARARRKRIVA